MTAHIDTHNAKSRESYQFNCEFVATSQENIDAHIGAHHETEQLESFSCDQCDYESIFQNNLLVHKCGDTNIQARKTFKIAWEPEFPRKIAFEHFEVKPTPITLINLVLCRKGPL